MLVLFGGPAGSGKSNLAAAWCSGRKRAAHIQLDEIRGLIVGGLADPKVPTDLQREQFLLAARACCLLAREFIRAGYDVAIDDVLYPGEAFDEAWQPHLDGIDWRVIVIYPTIEETLVRSSSRSKRVRDDLVREQYRAMTGWPSRFRVDTTGLGVQDCLALIERVMSEAPPERGAWD